MDMKFLLFFDYHCHLLEALEMMRVPNIYVRENLTFLPNSAVYWLHSDFAW